MILQYITPAGLQKSGLKARGCPTIRDETIPSGFALRHLTKEVKDARPGVRSLIP
jgi:hypothetical protein